MKIKETISTFGIDRECCMPEDLKPYNGTQNAFEEIKSPKFCVHCGQIWGLVREDEYCRAYPTFGKR